MAIVSNLPNDMTNKKVINIEHGGTGATTTEQALMNLGLNTLVDDANDLQTSINNSIGVIVTKSGEVNDERWLPYDGRAINKNDYPLLWEELTGGIDKLLFDRRLNDCQPEDGKTYSIYIKYKNYRLLGRIESSTGISYASFDNGITWQTANLSYNAIRYGSQYGDHFVSDNGTVLIADRYYDYFYISTDGLNFKGYSHDTPSTRCCNRRNGFIANADWNGKKYQIVYRIYTDTKKILSGVTNNNNSFALVPNKEGALYKNNDTGLYYYFDINGIPVTVTCEYPLCNSSSIVDDDFNIYTLENNILYIFNENYQLIGTKNMENYADASLRLVINTDLYFVSGSVLYRTENLLNDLENSKIVALNTSMPSGVLNYDGVNTLYLSGQHDTYGLYSVLGEVSLPSLSALDNLPIQSYIKAK